MSEIPQGPGDGRNPKRALRGHHRGLHEQQNTRGALPRSPRVRPQG
jgi:hypothetical protein